MPGNDKRGTRDSREETLQDLGTGFWGAKDWGHISSQTSASKSCETSRMLHSRGREDVNIWILAKQRLRCVSFW